MFDKPNTRSKISLVYNKQIRISRTYLPSLVFVLKRVITNTNKYTSTKRTFVRAYCIWLYTITFQPWKVAYIFSYFKALWKNNFFIPKRVSWWEALICNRTNQSCYLTFLKIFWPFLNVEENSAFNGLFRKIFNLLVLFSNFWGFGLFWNFSWPNLAFLYFLAWLPRNKLN